MTRLPRFLLTILAVLLMSLPATADPLFDSDETLGITLTAPFKQLFRERDKEKRYPAQLLWSDSSLSVEIQVRGNNRLKKETCDYPPLKIHFKKNAVKKTIFKGQSELKMVVACKTRYAGYVRMEYLIYKMFAMLSDAHFKARWLDVTYMENGKQRQASAFFIERKSRMGKRLALTQVRENGVRLSTLDHRYAVTVDLFQFMIGNVDYSNLQAPEDADCCHNVKLMAHVADTSAGYVPIPYDFDNAGIINARYATPPASIPIRSVTQRKYRGLCVANEHLENTITLFQSSRQAITNLVTTDKLLDDKMRKRAVKYLDGFYKILDNPKKRNRSITKACR